MKYTFQFKSSVNICSLFLHRSPSTGHVLQLPINHHIIDKKEVAQASGLGTAAYLDDANIFVSKQQQLHSSVCVLSSVEDL